MGNLLSQLGKDFVRSAVKQVGRDGGRIISNQVYNNNGGASPIEGDVDFAENMKDFEKAGTLNLEGRKKIEEMGYRISEGLNTFGGCAWAFFIIVIFPIAFLASAYHFVIGIVFFAFFMWVAWNKFNIKTRKMSKPYRHMTFDQDKRYKTGRKYAGDVIVDNVIEVELYDEEKTAVKKHAMIYVVIAVLFLSAGSIKTMLTPWYHQKLQERELENAARVDTASVSIIDDESATL